MKNNRGDMVPFSSFTTIEPTLGQSSVSRYNMYPAASLTFNTANGVSSSDGIKAGDRFTFEWTDDFSSLVNPFDSPFSMISEIASL